MELENPASIYEPLTSWFDTHSRDLPWRHTRDPWAILLCEVMSQQTPVARVEPTWHAWLDRWPTPVDLAAASPSEVLLAWNKMGYPRRALRLRECAIAITERFDGQLPNSREELLSLPGVGPYTADAVLAFAFKERSVVLDTNIRRVLARWHGDALPRPTQTRGEEQRANRFVPDDPEQAWRWNAAIMEFGALVCTARNPKCDQCPFTEMCEWFQTGKPEDAHAAKRVTQKWHGTNRQARGAILDVFRAEPTRESFIEADLRDRVAIEESRFERALLSLLEDGLIEDTDGALHLPR